MPSLLDKFRKFKRKYGSPVYPVTGGRISQQPSAGHRALDISARSGTPVYAATGGIVTVEQGRGGYGYRVRVRQASTGLEQIYAHLLPGSIQVRTGESIKPGTILAGVGSSGFSSGPHLHFEVNPIGPEIFRNTTADIQAIDPLAFLSGAQNAPAGAMIPVAGADPGKGSKPGVIVSSLSAVAQALASSAPSSPQGPYPGQPSGYQMATGSEPPRPAAGGIVQPVLDYVSTQGRRVGVLVMGYVLILIGVGIMAFSYRDEIGAATKSVRRTAKIAGGAAIGGPAGAAAGAAI